MVGIVVAGSLAPHLVRLHDFSRGRFVDLGRCLLADSQSLGVKREALLTLLPQAVALSFAETKDL